MDDKTEIPYETVIETMDVLNKAENKFELIVDFLANDKNPPASEYPELARVVKSYESAIATHTAFPATGPQKRG